MKKATKIWLIAATSLIVVGAILSIAVLAIKGWDMSVIGSSKVETTTFDIKDDFQNISIQSDTEDVVFVQSSDGKCQVTFVEQEGVRPIAEVKNGTLTIGTEDNRKWVDHISFMSKSPSITIALPKLVYGSLAIDETTGDIYLPAGFQFDSIDIKLTTGDVECGTSASGQIRIHADTGDLTVNGVSANVLDLTVTTGHVEVSSINCKENVSVSVGTEKAILRDISCKNFYSTGNTGDITMENLVVSEMISIERTTGDITLTGCDAGELLIKTDTGEVTGSLLSEKIFIV
ncbi:MAG: DUF4097 family beta strand repeat protein, partial [Candidatus Methanomethylophilaceae archaeon]|nr:DUF4097 family beta strand repeat protein [Candidatus Methanomethylophilaceae archaeon]